MEEQQSSQPPINLTVSTQEPTTTPPMTGAEIPTVTDDRVADPSADPVDAPASSPSPTPEVPPPAPPLPREPAAAPVPAPPLPSVQPSSTFPQQPMPREPEVIVKEIIREVPVEKIVEKEIVREVKIFDETKAREEIKKRAQELRVPALAARRRKRDEKLAKILIWTMEKGSITNDEVQIATAVADRTATMYLQLLVKQGKLKPVHAHGRHARYIPA